MVSLAIFFLLWFSQRLGFGGFLLLSWFWMGGWLATVEKSPVPVPPHEWTKLKRGQRIWAVGRLMQRVGWQPQQLSLEVWVSQWAWSSSGPWFSTGHRILLRVSFYPSTSVPTAPPQYRKVLDRWRTGDILRMRLRVRSPTWYANPGLPNRKKLLLQRNIRFVGDSRWFEIMRMRPPPRESFARRIEAYRIVLRQWFQRSLRSDISSGLLRALILGDRGGLMPEWRTWFAKTGTAHLLAISGLHLAIVAHLCWLGFGLMFGLSRRLLMRGTASVLASFAAFPIVCMYALLSGAAPSTQRALVMIGLLWLGHACARHAATSNTLALAAVALLVYQPSQLFMPSFQLSFLAVWALLAVPLAATDASVEAENNLWLARWFSLLRGLRAMCLASLYATLATLPLALAWSEWIPVWGPLVNLVAVPLGGYCVVGMGILAVGIGAVWGDAGSWCLQWSGKCAELLLAWVKWCASWPGYLTLFPLSLCEMIAYYMCLVGFFVWRFSRRLSCVLACLGVSLGCIGYVATLPTLRAPRLVLSFLDVGQGDATLIRFPNGQHMLVDAGGHAFGDFDMGARVLLPYFRWLRLQRLDFAVLSHPHPDHFDGFRALFEVLPIEEFWYNAQPNHHPRFRRLLDVLQRKRVRKRRFFRPTKQNIGGVEISVLHPFPQKSEGKTYYWSLHANDNSLVLLLKWRNIRILLTGDVERRAEEILVQRWGNQLKADILKVPHHGSRTSSTWPFLKQVRPRHSVFCVGRENLFGFPHPEVLRRYRRLGSRIWRTDLHGRISIITDGRTIEVKRFLPAHP